MTRAQRKNLSIKMKQVYAKKKADKSQKKFDFESAKNMQPIPTQLADNIYNLGKAETAQLSPVDLNYLRESNYRRGLVHVMECILRELR